MHFNEQAETKMKINYLLYFPKGELLRHTLKPVQNLYDKKLQK